MFRPQESLRISAFFAEHFRGRKSHIDFIAKSEDIDANLGLQWDSLKYL